VWNSVSHCGARVSEAAAGEGVNVQCHIAPFALYRTVAGVQAGNIVQRSANLDKGSGLRVAAAVLSGAILLRLRYRIRSGASEI